MAVVEVTEEAKLSQILNNNLSKLKLLYFYSEEALECGQMMDVLQELVDSGDYKDTDFVKINANRFDELGKKFNVSSVPSFIFHLNGEVDRLVGADVPALVKKLKEQIVLSSTGELNGAADNDEKELVSKLKKLINKAPCMLFMKGNSDVPKCGFSKQVLELLNRHKAKFETFDILEDWDVREGLKKYSDWPTYPQLYIKGELVGGLDILKELSESGELDKLLFSTDTDLERRLKGLINQAPVMIFMKGSPQSPRCGFSRTLIEMINKTGVEYKTFDILEEETIRNGLKKYSDWPTYPQIYVKGDLVGGFDIVKELHENNELKAVLEG